ncbi:peptidase M48 Ste24p [Solidesulfovibrio fructosivorans JJ]]|uniref:Peptidase M48 Ste24p n=1 Tax=Solidesulfovibrio fructosivorans JJ] TaxID=596151 RepID=E1JZH7_SOLFR|nr:M48 family metallopeptidase [Solidesulfovibrio fructosivorans]EFL50224.1 peptidase M48 Ste24p [Solidesulfovibrio fructosivorans JJ]]
MRSRILLSLAALFVFGFALYGCNNPEGLSRVLDSFGASVGGGQVGGYAASAVKSVKAVAHAAEDFTPEQEYYIGRAVGASLLTKYHPYHDAKANAYVNEVGQALAMFSDMPQTYGGYHFLIMDSAEINAFAAPGGLVFITRGMLRCCSGENALAAVLAHEIAHVEHKDALRAIKRARTTEALAIIGGEALKQAGGSDVARLTNIFADSIGDIMTTMVNNGYSRTLEYEADKAAVTILVRTGYNPSGLPDMLEEMQKRLTPGGADFAKTHPAPSDRIHELANLARVAEINEPPARMARFKAALGNI